MLKRLKWMSLLVLVFVCLIMASCSNNTTNTPNTPDNTDSGQSSTTHQHTWGEWNTVQDATCENKGYKTKTCSGCSKTEREDIDAKGHSFSEWETVTESTCTVEGQKKRVCPSCNTEETEVIAAIGHSFGESVQTIAPNCTDDGESKKICTVCEHEEIEVIPANGHNYVDYICSVCKAVVAEKAVQTVKIANTSLLLPLNTPVKLDVQVYPTDALYTSVTYTIDERNNSCGATITEDGVLSCTQLGSVRIRVTVDNVSSAYVTFNVPTEIRTAEAFDAIRNNLKGYYILCNDIDLSAYSTWTPIGYATKAADGSLSYSGTGFQGEFNGNGYTISGVNIDLEQTKLITVGLFGFVDTSAVVSNVKVEANVVGTASASEYIGTLTGVNYGVVDNCEVSSTVNISGALYVGGMVGQNNGNLTDCTADVSIKASNSNSNGYYVGGIAGQFVIGNMNNNTAKANIEIASCKFCYVGGITGNAYGSFNGTNCDATIIVSANSSATSYIGGVVGKVEDSDSEIAFDLDNTTITGSITVKKANKLYVGGIAGYGDVFENCINDVNIIVTNSNETFVGGIAGKSTAISNSTNTGNISVNSVSTVYVGGIAGQTQVLTGVVNYSDISATASYAYFGGVAGEANWSEDIYNYCYALSLNSSGSLGGVVGECTHLIENAYNTANLNVQNMNALLCVGGIAGDADMTGSSLNNVVNSGKIIIDVPKLGVAYIGGVAGRAASITNSKNSATEIILLADTVAAYYNADNLSVGGLCGYSSAKIDNCYSYASINIENGTQTISGPYNAKIGGLAGTAKNVSGSYATGNVSISLHNVYVNAGGLLGNLNGVASDSYARGSVTGVTTGEIKIGGLVAYAQSGSSVQNCYAAYNYLTTNITSNGSIAYVGGLIAHNLGVVTDSYAMNYINTIGSGSNDSIYAGGVIGYNNGIVSNSYSLSATGHVLNNDISVDIDCTSNLSANVYVGGFVGYNNKTITNCYAGAEVIGRGCYTGGFVGYQNTSGKISYALALAPVNSGISGQTHTGGFSGNDAGYYTSCIFSTTGTQIDASNGAGGATVSGIVGKSETDLLKTATLAGFDTSVWTIANGSIPTLALNNHWTVYNDGYDNFNVLKNVVNPDRQYVKVSDSTVEIKFESNWELPLPETVVLEKGTKIAMLPDLSAEGYFFVGWFTDAEFTKPFTVDGTYTVNEDITLYAYFRKIIATPESQIYTYNEEKITLGTLNLTSEFYTIEGVYEATDAGEYTVTLTLNKNYCWDGNIIDVVTVTWVIKNRPVSIPQSQTYTYSGEEFSLTTLDLTEKYYTIDGVYEATDAGKYMVTLIPTKNCCWSDGGTDKKTITWAIEVRSITIPTAGNYVLSNPEVILKNIDTSGTFYTISGIYKATEIGDYSCALSLVDKINSKWMDGTTEDKTIVWSAVNGMCGGNIGWQFYSNGVLVLNGTGKMDEYASPSNVPWYSQRDKIVSITVEDGITSISKYAFQGCNNLTSITIPFVGATKDGTSDTRLGYIFGASSYSDNDDYVPISLQTVIITGGASIGNLAFEGCSNLTSVAISNSVTSIGGGAFSGCSSLISITIPNSVTYIGNSAFAGCRALMSILVEDGNSKYHSVGNCLIETTTKMLILGCKNSVIPIDGSVKSIGSYAFMGCSSLTSIRIPNSVTSIGRDAFRGCSSLESITIPSNVTFIGDGAFYDCYALTRITIPNSVTHIASYTFTNCSNLTSITIPNSVTSIGQGAFGCSKLTSITIPSSVTSIDRWAFEGCSSLMSVTFENPNGWWRSSLSTATNGTNISSALLSNKLTAAEHLTSTYCGYYWKR